MNPGGSFGRSSRPSAGSQSGHGISRRSAFAGARRSECVPRQVGVSLTHEERVVAAFALGWHAISNAEVEMRRRYAIGVSHTTSYDYEVSRSRMNSRLEICDSSVTQVMTARATCVACDIALSQLVAKLSGKQPIGPTASAKRWITGNPTGASLQAHCRLQSAAKIVPRPGR